MLMLVIIIAIIIIHQYIMYISYHIHTCIFSRYKQDLFAYNSQVQSVLTNSLIEVNELDCLIIDGQLIV